MKDLDGRFLLANRRFALNRGMEVEDIIGKTNADLFPPDLAKTFEDHDAQVIAAGEPMEFEVESTDADWAKKTYLMIRFPITDTDGEMFGTGLVTTDITERKRAEKEAADQTRLLRLTLDNIGHGLLVNNPDSKQIVWNSLAAKMTGVPEEILKQELSWEELFEYQRAAMPTELFPADTVAIIEDFDRRRLAGEQDVEASFVRLGIEPDTWIKVTLRALTDGSVVRVLKEITEQRKADCEIEEQREILEDLFENVAQGLVAYDGEARVITWNQKYQDFLVFSDDDIYSGRPVWDLVMIHAERGTYDDSERATMEAWEQDRIDQLMSGEVVHFEYTNVHGMHMETVSAPRPQGDFVVTYADIT